MGIEKKRKEGTAFKEHDRRDTRRRNEIRKRGSEGEVDR